MPEQAASPPKAHVPFRGSSEAHREFHAHNLRDARQPPSPQKGLDHLRNKATFTATTRNQNDFRAPSASDYERPLHPPQHERGSVPFMGETTNHHDFVGHEPAHSRPRSPLKGKYAPSKGRMTGNSMSHTDFQRFPDEVYRNAVDAGMGSGGPSKASVPFTGTTNYQSDFQAKDARQAQPARNLHVKADHLAVRRLWHGAWGVLVCGGDCGLFVF